MAGVVVGDPRINWMAGSDRLHLGQKLGYVPHSRGEGRGPLSIARIISQQIAVFLECRAAAGDVYHDGIDFGALKDINKPACKGQTLVLPTCVETESSAAALRLGHHHVTALGCQYADSRGVDVFKEDPLHATEQHTGMTAGGAISSSGDVRSSVRPVPSGQVNGGQYSRHA